MLVTNVFKSFLSQECKKPGLFDKELKVWKLELPLTVT